MNETTVAKVEGPTPGQNVREALSTVKFSFLSWWQQEVIGTVDQHAVIESRREDCVISARYMLMLSMSAGIAILGLLLSSPAVVIGAMLLSPLMGPIMGLGFGLAIGDFAWTRQSAKSLLVGSLMSVIFCALIVFFSPLQTVTSEIAARTRPNLFDLLIALFSAVAGAYAVIRGREGTIVGVAIATALMPPLAVVGFGLATFNWTVFGGALMLFVTNMITIAGTAFVMAKLYGFRTSLTEKQTRMQFIVTLVAFVALAIPLGISLRQIANESTAQRDIQGAVLDSFPRNSRIADLQINWDSEPIAVSATVLTPAYTAGADPVVSNAVSRILDEEAQVSLTQIEVGTGTAAAERAQLTAAKKKEEASQRRADELAQRLSLAAGVPESDVTIDRQRRRATVRAAPLEGATLASYRQLETRIAATEPEWNIELRPPPGELPTISFKDGEPTADGTKSLALVAWAAKRIDDPVKLVGNSAEAERAAELLKAQGVNAAIEPGGGTLRAEWGDLGG